MRLGFEFKGMEDFARNLRAQGPRFERAGLHAMTAEANAVMSEAKKRAPRDFGDLAGSGYVAIDEVTGAVELGFGGPAAAYALPVHERFGTRMTTPGTGPKYLEGPWRKRASGMLGRLGARIRALVERPGAIPNPVRQHPQTPWEGSRMRMFHNLRNKHRAILRARGRG